MTDRESFGLADLRKFVEAYGANPDRWPTDVKRRFDPGELESPEISAFMQAERDLDALLDEATLFDPSPELAAEVLLLSERRNLPRWLGACWPFPAVWRPATVLTIALLVGILFGATYRPDPTTDYVDVEIDELLLG